MQIIQRDILRLYVVVQQRKCPDDPRDPDTGRYLSLETLRTAPVSTKKLRLVRCSIPPCTMIPNPWTSLNGDRLCPSFCQCHCNRLIDTLGGARYQG